MLYVAIDGDDIGRLLTQRIYQTGDKDEDVIQFSKMVADSFDRIADIVSGSQGKILFCAGDSILFKIDEFLLGTMLNKVTINDFTVSVGIGRKLKEAHWALNVAKWLGKARVVNFDEVRKDILG